MSRPGERRREPSSLNSWGDAGLGFKAACGLALGSWRRVSCGATTRALSRKRNGGRSMTLVAGLAVVVAAIVAVLRRVDVRLALILAALALGALAGTPALIVRTFVSTFSSEQFVVPLGC